jgi:hypothetical protein
VDKTEALSDIISSSPSRRTIPTGLEKQSWQSPVIAALVAMLVALGAAVAYYIIGNQEVAVPPKDSAATPSSGEQAHDRQEDAREAERLKQEEAGRREIARKAEQDRQREAAEAARKKVDEEKQRQEREAEEKRLAAAEEARHAAKNPPVAQPAPEVAAPASTRTDADAWKTKAEQFARDHLGRFIDDEPLIKGQAEIPLDIMPPAPATTTWFLGNGRIYLENPKATYPFGDGFEKELPQVGLRRAAPAGRRAPAYRRRRAGQRD